MLEKKRRRDATARTAPARETPVPNPRHATRRTAILENRSIGTGRFGQLQGTASPGQESRCHVAPFHGHDSSPPTQHIGTVSTPDLGRRSRRVQTAEFLRAYHHDTASVHKRLDPRIRPGVTVEAATTTSQTAAHNQHGSLPARQETGSARHRSPAVTIRVPAPAHGMAPTGSASPARRREPGDHCSRRSRTHREHDSPRRKRSPRCP